jgi:hypothetical protein
MSEIDIIVTETIAVEVPVSESATIIEVSSASQGPKGDSAYEVALENGFVGTELEWLESLKAKVAYTHVQSVSITTWVITHNLNYMPNVTVIDSGGNSVEGEIFYNNTNQLTLSFSNQTSGKAYLS